MFSSPQFHPIPAPPPKNTGTSACHAPMDAEQNL